MSFVLEQVSITNDSYRATILETYNPDYVDWSAGATMSRAGYTSNRGIPTSAPQQFEYDWGFAFAPDDPMQPYHTD